MGKKPNRAGNSHQRAKNRSKIGPPPDEPNDDNDSDTRPSLSALLGSTFDALTKYGIEVLSGLGITWFVTAAFKRGWLSHFWAYPIIGIVVTGGVLP